MPTPVKYIFVIGGVMSGVGKGVSAASLAKLIKANGLRTSAVKIDPYLNVDAGTMNPVEHGEVFVTEDGDETDQDIGNYERFLEENVLSCNYMTAGRVYKSVIDRERALEYDGKCVEAVPHIPEEVIRRLGEAARRTRAQVMVVEVGGTIGEYQNVLFFEAARMLKMQRPDDVVFVLVSYLPVPGTLGEMKTKPTQTASNMLNSVGIQADFIIGRSTHPLDEPRKEKLATFCGIPKEHVFSAPDVDNIYAIPLAFAEADMDKKILAQLKLKGTGRKLAQWRGFVRRMENLKKGPRIAVVGKYFTSGAFTLHDAYISVIEALKHGSWVNGVDATLEWVDAESFERSKKALSELSKYDGIFIPGGFGGRGVEGKIKAIRYAREHDIPFLGICYGMQLAAVEFARNVVGLTGAHTTEIKPKTKHPVIDILPEQMLNMAKKRYGGTMRLGTYTCALTPRTFAERAYSTFGRTDNITERHRHRFEFNNDYTKQFEEHGMVFSGRHKDADLVEIMELPEHPFFLGAQFHPEFKSRPLTPHPLYAAFLKAAETHRQKR